MGPCANGIFSTYTGECFYDYTNLKSLRTGTNYQVRSAGAEIYFDTKWWNQQPLSFGLRYSRLLDNDLVGASPNNWEIILPVTIFFRNVLSQADDRH